MRNIFRIIACCLVLFFCFSCSEIAMKSSADETIVVSVEENPNFQVLSENPTRVKKGENAYFRVSFDEGYAFKDAGKAYLDGDRIVLENVQHSQTIIVRVKKMINVYLNWSENDHFKVKSDNPTQTGYGEDANFLIEFDKYYSFESSDYGTYNDGVLTIKNVEKEIRVTLIAKIKGTIHYQVINDFSCGNVICNKGGIDDYGNAGDLVDFEAIPNDNYKFVCWTTGNTLATEMPYSFERKISIELTDDLKLYVNYWHGNDYTLCFDANGGSTLTGDTKIYFPFTMNQRIRVNTIQGSKAFYRSGFVLDSWNTKKDGSGERIGLGSRTNIAKDEIYVLYAQWVEETAIDNFDFALDENKGFYAITGCSSLSDCVVIPNKIDGITVERINKNSFVSLPFTKLYLPEHLKEVEDGSIVSCSNFEEIHLFDSLKNISDKFCVDTKPSFLYINANTDPAYGGSYQSLFCRKTDLLLNCNSEKIVFIGNSNLLYSIDGEMVANYFNKDVLCYGVQDGIGLVWETIVLQNKCPLDKNTIIFCSEFGATRSFYFTEHKFFAAESDYDLISLIDFNRYKYTNVFNAFSTFSLSKESKETSNYFKDDFGCDRYGCLKLDVESDKSEDWCSSKINVNVDDYSSSAISWINSASQSLINSKIYISICSFNKNAISADLSSQIYKDYQFAMENCGFKVISCITNYAYPGNAFTNDNYHLTYKFAKARTEMLISDIANIT